MYVESYLVVEILERGKESKARENGLLFSKSPNQLLKAI